MANAVASNRGSLWVLARAALKSAGLLGLARQVAAVARSGVDVVTASSYRRRFNQRRDFEAFARRHGGVFGPPTSRPADAPVALIVGNIPKAPGARSLMAKLIERAGYAPVVLCHPSDAYMRPYYELAGVAEIVEWQSTSKVGQFRQQADAMLSRCRSLDDVLTLDYAGVRVGRAALATTLRITQLRPLDVGLESPDPQLRYQLALAMSATETARPLVERLRPALTLAYEVDYTPKREIFELCLSLGHPVVVACRGSKADTLIVKRYTAPADELQQHPSSLSRATWERLQRIPWTQARRRELQDEWRSCYSRGDWWGIPSPLVTRAAWSHEETRGRLAMDATRKIAVVFAHVPWDASFCWGRDLFSDYQEWLCETVRAACANVHLNWVIKIHPANIGKSIRMRDGEEPIEVSAIRRECDPLPSHIVMLPAESAIDTPSLLAAADYCVTVRGTVGIEAASLGIPVLTCGTGRYDGRGFTIDSRSAADYLAKLTRLHEIPRLTAAQQELAERFAYGLFVLRPFPFEPALLHALSLGGGARSTPWQPDGALEEFSDWLLDTTLEDFIKLGDGC